MTGAKLGFGCTYGIVSKWATTDGFCIQTSAVNAECGMSILKLVNLFFVHFLISYHSILINENYDRQLKSIFWIIIMAYR